MSETERRLAAIRERDRARTPGEWEAYAHESDGYLGVIVGDDADGICSLRCRVPFAGDKNDPANAAFIAACSTDIPFLLGLVDRLSSLLDDVGRSGEGEMARQWERAAIMELVNHYAHVRWTGQAMSHEELIGQISARGPTPQDAPDVGAAREENDRLRAALREIVALPDTSTMPVAWAYEMKRIAREALGEEDGTP